MTYPYAMIIHPSTETIYMGFRNAPIERILSAYDYFKSAFSCDISEFDVVICNDGHITQQHFSDWYDAAVKG